MKECCATCRLWLNLVMFDYGHGGCEHHNMGNICMALASDGQVVWKVGNDPERDVCGWYEPKEDDYD